MIRIRLYDEYNRGEGDVGPLEQWGQEFEISDYVIPRVMYSMTICSRRTPLRQMKSIHVMLAREKQNMRMN
jgi:hypothetical protein